MSLLDLLETGWCFTTADYAGPPKIRLDPKCVGHVASSANDVEREDIKGSHLRQHWDYQLHIQKFLEI